MKEFELFGEAADGPSQSTHPGAERRIALLRVGAAIAPVVDVEDAFVGHAAGNNVVGIAPFSIIDRKLGGGQRVLDEAIQKRNAAVALAHEDVSETIRQ